MSDEEILRGQVMAQVMEGKLTQSEASARLKVTVPKVGAFEATQRTMHCHTVIKSHRIDFLRTNKHSGEIEEKTAQAVELNVVKEKIYHKLIVPIQ